MSILKRVCLLVIPAAIVAALNTAQVALAQEPAYIVTGGGTFLGAGGVPRFFGVAAADSGTSDFGEVQMSGRTAADETFAFHADVTCVNVVGNVAYVGGTVRAGTGFGAEDATGKVLRARFDEGFPDRAKGQLLAVGTPIPVDCFATELTTPGPAVKGQIKIHVVPAP